MKLFYYQLIKSRRLFLAIFLFALLSGNAFSQDYGKTFSVLINAEFKEDPAEISLVWQNDANATGWAVYRKAKNDNSWGSILVTLSKNDTFYNDKDVKVGQAYEYQVVKLNSGKLMGWGYMYAGMKVPEIDYRGNLLLIIDSYFSDSLKDEIERFINDVSGDGWNVNSVVVSRKDTVKYIKNLIKSEHAKDPDLKAVILLGHIAVPYSGEIAPDAHPNHVGAWPADMFYGELDGDWTDTWVNNTNASRSENQNVPGDGKYDPSSYLEVSSEVDLEVSRIDVSNLPVFSENEIQLMRRYLDKDHYYRTGQISVKKQAVLEDNFNFQSEGFDQNGWKNFTSLLGYENVKYGDYFTNLKSDSYLWSYGCGAGSYNSCAGVGTSSDFAKDSLSGIFTMLFGSYFGDWDSKDNLLRCAIASRSTFLTAIWAGRPNYFFHHMALGDNIGYSLLLSQNNVRPSQNVPANYEFVGAFSSQVHTSLMGDLTLREDVIKPPSNLVAKAVNGGKNVSLTWSKSADASILGYNIFRWDNNKEYYAKINSSIVSSTNYIDDKIKDSTEKYMVRAVKLEEGNSGSYYNLSQGIFDDVSNLSPTISAIAETANDNFDINVFPNPASEYVRLDINNSLDKYFTVTFFSVDGRTVFSKQITSSQPVIFDTRTYQRGVYLLEVRSTKNESIQKVILK